MTETIDIEAAKSWLDALPGGRIGQRLAERWHGFAAIDAPVITVYGSYDTGKSSLLRRLLIEFGQAVPSWLTISARHETYDFNEIRAGGCVLRDTPGFVVEGADARAQANTELASEAIVLADVAIVTVTPQLATAEYPVLRQLVQQDWVPGALWFVISRFDEAGVDPDDDPDGYRRLAERKIVELRTALNLDDAVPIHAVCADFAQMAGAERNPDPQVWQDSRDWDGIAGLVQAISDLRASEAAALRHAAEHRFWRNAVRQALDRLPDELQTHRDNAAVSDEGNKRRTSWLEQLDTLTRAAEADLRGRISAAINDALDSPDPAHGFPRALKTSIGAWHAASERDVDKLLRSVGETLATDRARPDWQRFDDLAARLRREPSDPDDQLAPPLIYAPVVGQIGDAVLGALRHYQNSRGLKPAAPAGAVTPPQGVDGFAAAAAGVTLIAGLATIAEEFLTQHRASERERADIRAGLGVAGEEATALALDELSRLVADARQRIIDATADQADLCDGLHHMIGELHTLIASGEALLAA